MSRSKQDLDRIVRTTQRICTVPAIPSQDWATQVAHALAQCAPNSVVGVLVTQFDTTSKPNKDQPQSLASDTNELSFKTISTGVGENLDLSETNSPRSNTKAIYLLDKLDRVKNLGILLPKSAVRTGLVAPLSMLDSSWQTTPLGRIMTAQQLEHPILAIVPVSLAQPGFSLIIIIATDPQSGDEKHHDSKSSASTESTAEMLAAMIPILSQRANIALKQVSNPKAWLTDREHEILDELILGSSVRVIAEKLARSVHTVHDHVKNLHKKLGASSRGELIAIALGHTNSDVELETPAPSPLLISNATTLAELKPQSQGATKNKSTSSPLHHEPAQKHLKATPLSRSDRPQSDEHFTP
jgi:DNA-binding CsgD family transcriptional regulator